MIRVGSMKNLNGDLNPNYQVDVEDDFISPFMKDMNQNEIITVSQKEPSKKAKVYLIEKETGITSRSYMYCSACQQKGFRIFRNVFRTGAPKHLKHCGSSDSELLRFCRSCWNNEDSSTDCRAGTNEGTRVKRPDFERSSLGLTDKRACFAWRFIQRDFARRKFQERDLEPCSVSGSSVDGGNNLTPLAVIIGQEGSGFIERTDSANLFCSNGRERSTRVSALSDATSNSIAANEPSRTECDEEAAKHKQRLKLLTQIRIDHDYAPTIQKEIEVATTGNSLDKKVSQALMQINAQRNDKSKQRRDNLKIDKNKQHVKNFADKLLKKASNYEASGKTTTKNIDAKLNMPIVKLETEIKANRKNGEVVHPSHLVGLKATAENGQTLPGLICPLCGKHTIKSYSVWRKDYAPEKILHLFRDGISVIRACRKCVPYPINRDKGKRKSWNESSKSKTYYSISPSFDKSTCNKIDTNHITSNNRKRRGDGSVSSSNNVSKIKHNGNIDDKSKVISAGFKGDVSNIKGQQAVCKGTEGRLTRIRLLNSEAANFLSSKIDESAAKRAKLDEEKRRTELANRQDLTGLECFELLPSEENIEGSTHLRIIGRDRTNENCSQNNTTAASNSLSQQDRPSKMSLECSKCSSALDRSYKSMTISKCPKKFVYLFDAEPGRRTLRLCKTCCQ